MPFFNLKKSDDVCSLYDRLGDSILILTGGCWCFQNWKEQPLSVPSNTTHTLYNPHSVITHHVTTTGDCEAAGQRLAEDCGQSPLSRQCPGLSLVCGLRAQHSLDSSHSSTERSWDSHSSHRHHTGDSPHPNFTSTFLDIDSLYFSQSVLGVVWPLWWRPVLCTK